MTAYERYKILSTAQVHYPDEGGVAVHLSLEDYQALKAHLLKEANEEEFSKGKP